MRILMAGKFAPDGKQPMGGSQSWIATVADELKRRGHQVALWEPGRTVHGQYDLGILQHLKHTKPALKHVYRSIQVSHGIINEEAPSNACSSVAFVSEGVRDYWGDGGSVIRQPIDLRFWFPIGLRRQGAIRFSYRRNELPWAEKACAKIGLGYRQVSNASPGDARRELSSASLVFATGRAALEAMACGAEVCIYDNRSSYQRPLLGPDTLTENMHQSYSGRGGHEPTLDELVARISRGMTNPREWVARHHDVRNIVDEILAC